MPGKTMLMIEMAKAMVNVGKSVVIMTTDQRHTIERYSRDMPGVLFEVKGDNAIIPHKPKKR